VTLFNGHDKFLCLLQHKSLVFENFPTLSSHGQKPNQKIIIILHMDNGAEFVNKQFKEFFYINEILRQFIMPYIP
jgi:transposase InsO family protein